MNLSILKITWGLLFLFLIGGTALAADDYGNIYLDIQGLPAGKLPIQRALLFQGVTISYDSTVLVQNPKGQRILYYPQMNEGSGNVLQLIIGEQTDSVANFYDVYVDLGDTLQKEIRWTNRSGSVFLAYNGLAQPFTPSSRNISGSISLDTQNKEAVAGTIDIRFQQKLLMEDASPRQIILKGDFDVPVGKYRESSIAAAETEKQKKNKYRNNIYLAVVISIFILAIFGFK
ncbi:MAG: hypothetical protein WAN36_15600 [Calditrichia bacterium]